MGALVNETNTMYYHQKGAFFICVLNVLCKYFYLIMHVYSKIFFFPFLYWYILSGLELNLPKATSIRDLHIFFLCYGSNASVLRNRINHAGHQLIKEVQFLWTVSVPYFSHYTWFDVYDATRFRNWPWK